jgi:outer membrane protein
MTRGGLILNALSIFIIAFVMFLYNKSTEKKIAYVKTTELYDGFQMKKELETKYVNVEKARKNILDSLELELKLMSKKLDSQAKPEERLVNEFEGKKENYFMKKKQWEEDNTAMANQYTQQIMKQINQYVDAYGKEKHYTYILGADGSGVILQADESLNLTQDILKYINLKYKGLN